jgi:hypothetical protein
VVVAGGHGGGVGVGEQSRVFWRFKRWAQRD